MARAAVEEKFEPTQPAAPSMDRGRAAIPAFQDAAPPASDAQPDRPEVRVQDTQAAALHSTERPKAPSPLKDISLQLGQSAGHNVEVRLVERAGELHVAVRTGDTVLAHGLREGLSEVVGRLGESGFRTETWHPGASVAAVSAATETQNTSSDLQGEPQGQRGSAHQDGGRRDQHQSNQPEWVQEFETSLTERGNQGESYGFSN
jgi:hypothetical protein